jgi:hypothetical protein
VKNKTTLQERLDAKLKIAKQEESALTLKEVTEEQDQPRLVASVRKEEDPGL